VLARFRSAECALRRSARLSGCLKRHRRLIMWLLIARRRHGLIRRKPGALVSGMAPFPEPANHRGKKDPTIRLRRHASGRSTMMRTRMVQKRRAVILSSRLARRAPNDLHLYAFAMS
jgi:hypothetical protein